MAMQRQKENPMSEQVDLSKWKKLLGRFHGSEVASWRDDPRVKVVKTDV